MIIKELELTHFGKFTGEKIDFGDGINVIYGPNEAGKTTVYTAIGALLFGIDKKRGRSAQTDAYTTYQPWENKTWYEAGMKFETGGKVFCLKRSFYQGEKQVQLICETDGEELSVEQGDLKMLLGDLEADLFFHTAAAGQLKAKPGEPAFMYLKNYIGNLEESGSRALDVVGALELLEKRRKALEQEKKKSVLQIQREISDLQAQQELVEREMNDCRSRLEQLEFGKISREVKEQGKRKNLLQRIITWFLGIFKRKHKKQQEEVMRQNEMKRQERLLLTRELLGEKESLWEELEFKKEVFYKKLHEYDQAEELRAIELAMKRILELSAARKEEVLKKLEEKASEALRMITGGKYFKLALEENFEPKIWDGKRMLRLFQVSTGCADQVYLSLRIGLQDLFFQEEEIPLMFDDAFVYFDDCRLGQMLKCLEGLNRQVLIFSCHKREQIFLEKQKIPHQSICL